MIACLGMHRENIGCKGLAKEATYNIQIQAWKEGLGQEKEVA